MDDCSLDELLNATKRQLAEVPATRFNSRTREPEAHEPYGRVMLSANEQAELLLMCWAPNRPCAPHDHGDARGFIRVLEGRLTETSFRIGVSGLECTRERELCAGDVIAFEAGVVHQMRAHVRARTLHLYRPRIHGMRVWGELAGRVLVVDDSHGAFVPTDASRIVTEMPWPTLSRAPTGLKSPEFTGGSTAMTGPSLLDDALASPRRAEPPLAALALRVSSALQTGRRSRT